MDRVDRPSSPIKCWLKNVRHEEDADDFVRLWDGKTVEGSVIQCEKEEEEELELCDQFRLGRCQKHDCDWEHVECQVNGSCSKSCQLGHKSGEKSEADIFKRKSNIPLRTEYYLPCVDKVL